MPYKHDERWGREWLVPVTLHLFSRMYIMENEQELYCQTISMGKFFDVNKKEVLENSKFGP